MRLLIASLFLTSLCFAQTTQPTLPEYPTFPSVAIGQPQHRVYDASQSQSTFQADDNLASVKITKSGDDFELSIVPKSEITQLWFPWQPNQGTLNNDRADDIVIMPLWSGMAHSCSSIGEWAWTGHRYPELSFSPVVSVTDWKKTFTVAAVNWPPKQVMPMYSLGRVGFVYDEKLKPGVLYTYKIKMINSISWQYAADEYAAWLNKQMKQSGIYPKYTNKERLSNGWLGWGLNNVTEFKPAEMQAYFDNWISKFDRIQIWGQMSNYGGPPELAKPPLLPGEQVGCCLDIYEVHPRYLGLKEVVDGYLAQGIDVGFYVRGRGEPIGKFDDPTVLNGKTNLQFTLGWIESLKNQVHGNVIYFDVFGQQLAGDGIYPALVLKNLVPPGTVIEGVKDFYPTSFMTSGSIYGIGEGAPGKTIKKLGVDFTSITYPEFARFILGDRIFYLGQTNSDYLLWGSAKQHWGERKAFLLGAKLDTQLVIESWSNPNVINPCVQLILDEWRDIGWWARNPVYRGESQLSEIPDGVQISRFIDKDNVQLFVIDNWDQQVGKQFKYKNKVIDVPARKLSIITEPAVGS